MKKAALIIALFLMNMLSFSQETSQTKPTMRFGFNAAFFGQGDELGKSIYGEFVVPVNEYIAIAPRLIKGTSYDYKNGIMNEGMPEYEHTYQDFDVAHSTATALTLEITPLPNQFKALKINIGPVKHEWHHAYGRIYDSSYSEHDGSSYIKDTSYGLIGSVQLNFLTHKNLEVGGRVDMITAASFEYFECLSIQSGFYLGVRM